MEDEQGTSQPADHLTHLLGVEILEELSGDGERPAGQQHLGLALRFDLLERAPQMPPHVPRLRRRRDRRYRPTALQFRGGLQHRRATQRVADQDGWPLVFALEEVRRGDQVAHVGRERRVGEVAFAFAETRKIEPQYTDPGVTQRPADIDHGLVLFRAGEAMREERVGDRSLIHRELESS